MIPEPRAGREAGSQAVVCQESDDTATMASCRSRGRERSSPSKLAPLASFPPFPREKDPGLWNHEGLGLGTAVCPSFSTVVMGERDCLFLPMLLFPFTEQHGPAYLLLLVFSAFLWNSGSHIVNHPPPPPPPTAVAASSGNLLGMRLPRLPHGARQPVFPEAL